MSNWTTACEDEQCDVCKRLLTVGEEVLAHRDYKGGPVTHKCGPCVDKEADELTGRCLSEDPRYNEEV